jgi:hypothetical protein
VPDTITHQGDTVTVRFAIDGNAQDEAVFEAVRIARRWNGWAVPVVTADTLTAILEDLKARESVNAPQYRSSWSFVPGGSLAILMPDDEESTVIVPDVAGLYTLDMGWTWDTLDD